MPISRYEIRNEYSLADPELYRAADKDDPEALLEGVAMAGLVGVLRQLGDLAEFAAEIFHDLHEEVMATAARGHSLTIRVQQLETEVPSIERAFLSQTDHSPFFYNSGVDWHPNLQMDQSLITRGDLPRFVMDSYEECRGPPRLFLLDKFDVAGAGACLKRYTDPSFFKFEASATNADIQREKKIRKPKKKGPRWRIGETPGVLPMSQHAKLHQLFLGDLVENGANKLPCRGKLKRRLTGFPFDSKTGKSYMEKLLRTPSPEHRVLEITASSPWQLPSNDHNESDHEVLEVRSVSPSRESVARKISPPSPDGEEIQLKPFMYVTNEVPNSYLNIATDNTPSISDEVSGEKDITIDRESKTESSLNGYESDDIASEIDNYVDAPSTMESEMDTDSELRVKNDFTSYNKREELISVETEEHHPQSSDSQSTGDLKLSDERNNSSKKETSSFSSTDSPNTSPEKPHSEEMSAEGIPSSDIPGIAIADALSYHKSFYEDFPVDQLPKPVVSDNTCTDKDTRTNNGPDSEQLTSSSCSADSTTILVHYHSKRVRKGRLGGPYSDETARTSNDEEKKIKQIVDSQSSPSVSYFKSRSGDKSLRFFSREHSLEKDNSLRYFSREHSLDEPNGANEPCQSVDSDIIRHSTDSSAATSVHLLHEDGYDLGDVNQVENTMSTLNMSNVLSQKRIDTAEMTSTKNLVTDKLDSEVPKLPENFSSDDSDHTDIAHNGDIVTPMISEGKHLNDVLEIEDSNIVSDVSLGKELLETSLHNAETVNPEEHYSNGSLDHQISSETLVLSPKECSPDFPDVDAHDDREVIAEEEAAVNGTPQLQSPKSYEVDEFQDREKITDDVTPNDCALESSCHTPQHETSELESPKSCEVDELQGREKITDDATPNDCVALDTPENLEDVSDTGLEVTEISSPTDLEPLNEVHVQSDEADYQTDLSEIEAMASSVPAVPDTAIRENVRLPVDVDKLVEEDTPCFEDSDPDALENNKNSLPGSHVDSDLEEEDNHQLLENYRQPGLVDEVDEREATTSDLCTDSSEVSQMVPNSYLDSKVVGPTQIQSLEKSSIDTDQESVQQHSVENRVFDDTKEKMLQEKIELPPDQTDEDWLSLLPINDQKMLDDNDHKGDNNSVLSFSLDNYPPSVSEHPKDPLGFVFPPSNPFSETNEMNVDELPPLPPLPPVQWRMGKLQHASSTMEEETMTQNKELFTQEISFLTAASIDVNSEEMNRPLAQIVKEEKVEHGSSSLEANSKQETIEPPAEIENKHPQLLMPASESEVTTPAEKDVNSPLEEMNHSLDQIVKEEKVDHSGSSSLEANSMRDTIEPSAEIETKHPYLAMPVSKSEIMTPAEEDVSSSLEELNHSLTQNVKEEKVELERGSSSLEVKSMHETVDTPPEIENRHPYLAMPVSKSEVTISPADEDVSSSLEEMNDSLNQIVPESTLKEEKVGHETIDPPPEIENKHPQVFVPASKSEVTTPEEEDGFANRTQTKKLPLPRNPLVEDVSVLDKSKLRKVTERVIPQMQKADERDSILEQIRAKSFSLKPAATSRPSIQGPKTNLNVAAILEKANAIRQAFAGSDDDDDDNWSDS